MKVETVTIKINRLNRREIFCIKAFWLILLTICLWWHYCIPFWKIMQIKGRYHLVTFRTASLPTEELATLRWTAATLQTAFVNLQIVLKRSQDSQFPSLSILSLEFWACPFLDLKDGVGLSNWPWATIFVLKTVTESQQASWTSLQAGNKRIVQLCTWKLEMCPLELPAGQIQPSETLPLEFKFILFWAADVNFSHTHVMFPKMFLKLWTRNAHSWFVRATAKTTSNLDSFLRLLKTTYTLEEEKSWSWDRFAADLIQTFFI